MPVNPEHRIGRFKRLKKAKNPVLKLSVRENVF